MNNQLAQEMKWIIRMPCDLKINYSKCYPEMKNKTGISKTGSMLPGNIYK